MKTTIEKYNDLIRIPNRLTADDGRIFRIREWTVTAGMGIATSVKIDAGIEPPENSDPIDTREMR